MASFKDLRRLIDGVTLITKEIARRSEILESARTGDYQSAISSSLKKIVVSVTDFAGLTKGKVNVLTNRKPKETIVYFPNSLESEQAKPICEIKVLDSQRSHGGEVRDPVVSTKNTEEIYPPLMVSADVDARIGGGVGNLSVNDSMEEYKARNGGEFHDFDSEISMKNTEEVDPHSVVSADLDATNGGVVENLSVNVSTEDYKAVTFPSKDNTRQEAKVAIVPVKRRKPHERRVPSTPFTRALGFAGLGAGLAWGTIQESAKRLAFGNPNPQEKSLILSEQNAKRLALALCRMRGAALKVGQMLSIQDESLVPAPILDALDIVRQGADVMPRDQLDQVLEAELGTGWTSKLQSFDYEPLAAASIGQVHRAVTKDGLEVAMKIQYPGVADSIQSDIKNVKRLLDYTNLIPKGLYLDRAMQVAEVELSRECDYVLEAANQKRFRDLLSESQGFYVPVVIDDISSRRVLTTGLVSGVPIDKVALLDQKTRDYVGTKLLELTLMELFVFRFMQTDPNWGNFLYEEGTSIINLIDFGAAMEYPKRFVDNYLRMVLACANCDRDRVIEMSRRLGFLTGMESEIMLDAHVQAGFVVGLPFSKPGGYDFRSTNITQSISNLGSTMLKHRLTPPPDEVYSLHRKLSGAFLACIKLGAVVPCRELLLKIYEHYQFADDGVDDQFGSSTS